jgi:hypothetical protein
MSKKAYAREILEHNLEIKILNMIRHQVYVELVGVSKNEDIEMSHFLSEKFNQLEILLEKEALEYTVNWQNDMIRDYRKQHEKDIEKLNQKEK